MATLPRAMPVAEDIIIQQDQSLAAPVLIDPYNGAIIVDPPQGHPAHPGTSPHHNPNIPHYEAAWTWQGLPDGLIYRSYLAGAKEPRLSAVLFHGKDDGLLLDGTIGGRVGLFRYGTIGGDRPEGWQFDVEAAAFPRLDPAEDMDLRSADFRGGAVLTRGVGKLQGKFGYYHLSSHVGDEFLLKNPDFDRLNYSRDALVLGYSYFPSLDLRLFAETAWAFRTDGGSEPWEFQLGFDYSPVRSWTERGSPFLAVNGHLREEHKFGGNVVLQTGWQWRGHGAGRLLRTGFHYYNGKSPQFSFYDESEEHLGVGLWYDF